MGTKTLLNGVNDVLKRMGVIKGNSGELASLTDEQRQVLIDLAVSAWNETVVDLYDSADIQLPSEMGMGTITLATGDRDYSLPANLILLRFPLKNETNGNLIEEYNEGYGGMFRDQLQPANYTGRPYWGCIRPSDGQLYLDRIPTANENGEVYTYLYDKSVLMVLATDVFPFSDDAYTILVPAVTEIVKMGRDEQSDSRYKVSMAKYRKAIGQAAGLVRMLPQRTDYTPVRYGASYDPMEA